MRMLDALNKRSRAQAPASEARQPRSGSVPFILGTVIAISLSAALPASLGSKQDQTSGLVDVLTAGKHSADVRMIPEHMDAWLTFSKDISGVVSADDKVIDIPKETTVTKRKVRLVPKGVGRTVVTIQYADGGSEQLVFTVKRDLSVLEAAMKSIHPSIDVDVAPDREAIVLTGLVPDGSYSARAAQAASDYASASRTDQKASSGKVINLIRLQAASGTIEQSLQSELSMLGGKRIVVRRIQQGGMPDDTLDVFVITGAMPDLPALHQAVTLARTALGDKDGKRIVTQLESDDQLTSIEQVLERAIHEQLHAPKVKVSRVAQMDPTGDTDVLVMTGSVPNQTVLVQTLTLASKVFQQQELVRRKRAGEIQRVTETFAGGLTRTTETPLRIGDTGSDIKVAADESGALRQKAGKNGTNSNDNSLRGIFSAGSTGSSLGSGSGFSNLLDNKLEANIARAKAVELADGRIVSFLTVDDLPQVRVNIKLYEINRTDLLEWDSSLNSAKVADFDTNGINPNAIQPPNGGTNADGEVIRGHQNTDISNVISFLAGGFNNRFQVGGGRFAVDAAFNLLESQGIAKTLSSPSLTVLSGETAAFGDGGSITVQNTLTTGVGVGSTVSFPDKLTFGIHLAVRPLVDEDGYITLDVVPSVSNPDFELTQLVRVTTGTPQVSVSFAEKSMSTTARLRDGEVLLIGGVTDSSRTDKKSDTPGLAQIPILGWLFHDKSFQDKNRELVISLNPTIVRDTPVEARMWAYPPSIELMPHREKPVAKPAAEGKQ